MLYNFSQKPGLMWPYVFTRIDALTKEDVYFTYIPSGQKRVEKEVWREVSFGAVTRIPFCMWPKQSSIVR
jgi:hypothetical protein